MPLASFLFSTKRVKNKMKTVEYLLGHIDELLMKKPFLRGGESSTPDGGEEGVGYVPTNCKLRATTPRTRKFGTEVRMISAIRYKAIIFSSVGSR